MDKRQTLISSGQHIGAVRRLGETYSTEEYLVAVEAARDARDGERYADAVLGPDVDAIVTGTQRDGGEELVRAAERRLRRRGIDPVKATYREFSDALAARSS